MTSYDPPEGDFALSIDDVRRAADEGVLAHEDAERLVEWGREWATRRPLAPPPAEQRPGLNLVTVAYYSGARLVMLAGAWFLAEQWDELGSLGVFATALVYTIATAGSGLFLSKRGWPIAGGLLVTVAVSLVPLLTYAALDLAGLWSEPEWDVALYPFSYHLSHIAVAGAALVAGVAAARFVKIAFLAVPIAVSAWFLGFAVAELALGDPRLGSSRGKSYAIAMGLATIGVGYLVERWYGRRPHDYAFWCYVAGTLSFWSGLTLLDGGDEIGRLVYAAINVALVWAGTVVRRGTFVVFGAIGIAIYLGHLAYEVFENSIFFPFAVALIGLGTILATVWLQRRMRGVYSQG
jgi:hypothetical protein